MIQRVLQTYLVPELIPEFKGHETKSGHMIRYIRWQQKRDVSTFMDKKFLKYSATTKDTGQPLYKQQFYVKLVGYPTFQNFIAEKFFPLNLDDNIRQLHTFECLKVNDKSKLYVDNKKK